MILIEPRSVLMRLFPIIFFILFSCTTKETSKVRFEYKEGLFSSLTSDGLTNFTDGRFILKKAEIIPVQPTTLNYIKEKEHSHYFDFEEKQLFSFSIDDKSIFKNDNKVGTLELKEHIIDTLKTWDTTIYNYVLYFVNIEFNIRKDTLINGPFEIQVLNKNGFRLVQYRIDKKTNIHEQVKLFFRSEALQNQIEAYSDSIKLSRKTNRLRVCEEFKS